MHARLRESINSYPGELEEWVECSILNPLRAAWCNPSCAPEYAERAVTLVQRAIQERLLESYHSGQQAAFARSFRRR
jgi:hypothetical protein